MVSLIKRIVRWAKVTRSGKDNMQFPAQQVTYNGKVADSIMVFPYGMHANVDGDSLALMFAVDGDAENRAVIPTSMTRRSALSGGDVEIYSPVSRSRITIRSTGGIEVDASTMIVTASTLNITAVTSITGDTGVTGDVTVSGSVTAGSIVSAGGMSAGGSSGVSGSFTTNDGKTVTVTEGLITSIV